MARPLRIQYPGAFYHIMCRGNKGSVTFIDDHDRHRFLFLLAETLEVYDANLYAYILMHNHFHLILQTQRPNLAAFMRRFNICYTGWFNYHHGTYGHLYQGRYKSLVIDEDKYLLSLSRYIHLNPLRSRKSHGADYRTSWRTLQQYQWSTLHGYIKTNRTVDFVCYDMILNMIGGRKSYQKYIIDGLKKRLDNPFADIKYQTILGSEDFVQRIKGTQTDSGSPREQPAYRGITKHIIASDIIINLVAEHLGISRESLLNRYQSGIARGMASDFLYRFSDLNLREIGNILNIDYSAVYKLRFRLKAHIERKKEIFRIYKEIERRIRQNLSNV